MVYSMNKRGVEEEGPSITMRIIWLLVSAIVFIMLYAIFNKFK